MKKFIYLLVISCLFIFSPKETFAQPQPFAGGEIVINHVPVGDDPCGTAKRYEVILKFYRDCGGGVSQFPGNPTVWAYNPELFKSGVIGSDDGFKEISLTELADIGDRGEIENICIKGDPICTAGKWYRGFFTLEESDVRWQIKYVERYIELPPANGRRRGPVAQGFLINSPENYNIDQGQRFSLRSDILVQCTEPSTDGTGAPPDISNLKNETFRNRTANLITEDLVETFCHGQEYQFQLAIQDTDNPRLDLNLDDVIGIDGDGDGFLNFGNGKDVDERLGPDSLFFELTSPFRDGENSAFFTFPYTSQAPLPVDPLSLMEVSPTGFITFTPRLLPGEDNFFGVVTYKVSEFRQKFVIKQIQNVNEDPNDPNDDLIDSLVLEYDPEPIAVTYRQFRYVIDRSCNENLPEFTAGDVNSWNPTEQAWELECGTRLLSFRMTKPMYENSLKRSGRLTEEVDDLVKQIGHPDDTKIRLINKLWRKIDELDPEDNRNNLDLRIVRGEPQNPTDVNGYPIIDIIPINQSERELALGEFSQFAVILENTIGPGNYSMYFKLGGDPNTLINRCGFQIEELTSIPLYVNDDFKFQYFGGEDTISICYPQQDIEFFPLRGQPNVGSLRDKFLFTFTYSEDLPPPPHPMDDTAFSAFYAGSRSSPKNSYREPIEIDTMTGDPIFKEGLWTVGLGRIYTHEDFNGNLNDEVCYEVDQVLVGIFENAEVVPRDWDLCPEEEWPTIDLDSMSSLHNAVDFRWGLETEQFEQYVDSCLGVVDADNNLSFPCLASIYAPSLNIIDTVDVTIDGDIFRQIRFSAERQIRDNNGVIQLDTIPVGGSGNTKFPLSSVAFGQNAEFLIESIVQLENGSCFDTSYFNVRKEQVIVDIGEDTIICLGNEYYLENKISYFSPDKHSYEWYFNGELIPDSDTNAYLIEEEGTYKLIAYKSSELDKNGDRVICMGEDEIFIDLADDLVPPVPECSRVTFQDSVRQLWFWEEVEGADGYQVQTVTPDGEVSEWMEANENAVGPWFAGSPSYNQLHATTGQEIKLIVRAYNLEVDEEAICRFGPPSFIAPACNILIRPINIFTPNGDGINDKLRFDLLELYEGNHLQVFNRWGRLVYENTNYLNDWDGEDYEDGTYFYVLEVGDGDVKGTKNSILKGTVTIVR